MTPDKTTASAPPAATRTEKLFTVEQANGALVLVRRVVADIVRRYATLLDLRTERQALAGTVASQPRLEQLRHDIDAAVDALSRLHGELVGIGCVLKDWVDGLVDFPAVHRGRPVWLCWRLGEPAVCYWHESQAGFAGRKSIGADFSPDCS